MGGRLGIADEGVFASKFAMRMVGVGGRSGGTGVKVLVLPVDRPIWELSPVSCRGYDGPFVTADDCAADIVTAMEDPDGFEYHVPEQVPAWAQKDLVVGKSQNCDQFSPAWPMAAVPKRWRGQRFDDRNAVQHRVPGERIDRQLVGEQVAVDAGVRRRDAHGDAGRVVSPAVRHADDAGHDRVGDLDGHLQVAGARAYACRRPVGEAEPTRVVRMHP